MINLRFKVDPEYLKFETEVTNPIRVKFISVDEKIASQILGESGRIMAKDGAIFIIEKELAYRLVREGSAVLV